MKSVTKISIENDVETAIWFNNFERMLDVELKWFTQTHKTGENMESDDIDMMFSNAVLFANRIVEKYRTLAK